MSMVALADALDGKFGGRIERDFPLARLTTYRLGGPAALYLEPSGPDDLEELGRAMAKVDLDSSSLEVLTLGRGSNLVVSDEGWPGLVVRLGSAFSWVEAVGDTVLRAGSSVPLPQLANWAVRRSLSGLEFAVAIPGSLGGAIRMNAGAHGAQVADCLRSLRIFDFESGLIEARDAAELDLGYRRSNLTENMLVVDALMELTPDEEVAIKERMEAYRRHRAETQPGAVQNAGSVFKNPPGDSAGRLVEAAGLKGFSVGGASVSDLHANFFIADEGSTAQDVFDLVHAVQGSVEERFGVRLEPEVRFVGRFRDRSQEVAQ